MEGGKIVLYILEIVFFLLCLAEFIVSVVFLAIMVPFYEDWVVEPFKYIESDKESLIKAAVVMPIVIFSIIAIISIIAPFLVLYTYAKHVTCRCLLISFAVVFGLVGVVLVGVRIAVAVVENRLEPEANFKNLHAADYIVMVGYQHHPEGYQAAKQMIYDRVDKYVFTTTYSGFKFKEGIVEWGSKKLTTFWNTIQTDNNCCGNAGYEDFQLSLWYIYYGSKVAKAVPSSCCDKEQAKICGQLDRKKAKIINAVASFNGTSEDVINEMKKDDAVDLYMKLKDDQTFKDQIDQMKELADGADTKDMETILDKLNKVKPMLKNITKMINATSPEGLKVIHKEGCSGRLEKWVANVLRAFKVCLAWEGSGLLIMTILLICFVCIDPREPENNLKRKKSGEAARPNSLSGLPEVQKPASKKNLPE